jgi:biopolymer transport protein ExbD
MKFRSRRPPEINSTSSADIAFLLLVFFLVTSSFDAKTGIYRKMNPPESEALLKSKTDILEKNLLECTITANNRLLCNGEEISTGRIRERSKTFIASSDIPKHAISLTVSREASYQTYLSVIGELTAAYNELRNEASHSRFNRSFLYLKPEEKDSIRMDYPMHIAETEQSDQEGGPL